MKIVATIRHYESDQNRNRAIGQFNRQNNSNVTVANVNGECFLQVVKTSYPFAESVIRALRRKEREVA